MLKRVFFILILLFHSGQTLCFSHVIPLSERANLLQQKITDFPNSDSIPYWKLKKAQLDIEFGLLALAKTTIREISSLQTATPLKALLHETKGLYWYEVNQYDQALIEYDQALQLYESLNAKTYKQNIFELMNNIGRVHIVSNDLERAEKYFQSILEYAKKSKPSEIDSIELSNAYNSIGALHFYLGELDQAYQAYDMARTIAIMSGSGNSVTVARAYYNMGLVREEKDILADAVVLYQKALEIYQLNLGEHHQHIAEVYGAMGNIHLSRLELEKAKYYFQKDLHISQKIYGDNHLETSWGYENLGRVYVEERKPELAKDMYSKALSIRKNTYQSPHIYVANIHLLLAQLETNIPQAIKQAIQAREIENKVSPKPTTGKWNISYFLLKKYIEANQLDKAKVELREALKIGSQLVENQKHTLFAKTYIEAAKIFWKEKNIDKSQEYIELALLSSISGNSIQAYETPHIDNINLLEPYIQAITLHAEILYNNASSNKKQKLFQVAEQINQTVEVVETHQRRRTSDDFSKHFKELHRGFYEAAMKVNLKLWEISSSPNYLANAFEFAERIKINSSLELLTGLDAHKLSNIPETTLRKEYKLIKDILYYQSIVAEGGEQQYKASQKLFNLFEEERKFQKNLKKMHPEYFQAKYNLQPTNLKEIQKNLRSNQAIVHSTWINESEYIFTITKQSIQAYVQEKNLYTHVVNNLKKENIKSIISIPDFDRPWKSMESVKHNGKYLIEDFSFIYNSSVKKYFTKNSHQLINRKILALAPIEFSLYSLPDLKNSIHEIAKLEKYYKVKGLIKEAATKKQFYENLLNFGALHISSHISYDPINPLKSKLYLYPDNDQYESGILHAHDIFGTPMRTQLITLSACDSKNLSQGQQGIAGIADAFAYNGCKNILLSLWEVEDKIAAQISSSFYKYLSKGYSKDRAMQQAKIEYLQQADRYKLDDFYWTGFILQGNHDKLKLSPSPLSRKWGWVAIISLSVVIGIRRLNT